MQHLGNVLITDFALGCNAFLQGGAELVLHALSRDHDARWYHTTDLSKFWRIQIFLIISHILLYSILKKLKQGFPQVSFPDSFHSALTIH